MIYKKLRTLANPKIEYSSPRDQDTLFNDPVLQVDKSFLKESFLFQSKTKK